MTKRKLTKHEDDVRRGLRTAQYNGIIDTQLAEIARLNNYIERLEVRNAVLVPENARLKAEVERLKANDSLKTVSLTESTNWQAIGDYAETKEENARLKAEVERLKEENGNNFVMKEEWYLKCLSARAEVERLREAGDAVALDYAERIEIEAGNPAKTLMKTVPVLRKWQAAKGSQGCIVNPNKVAQYLPKPPAAKEGKQS